MPKTVIIDDDVHTAILDEKSRIKKKYDIDLKISYIVSSVLRSHIYKIEKILIDELSKREKNAFNKNGEQKQLINR